MKRETVNIDLIEIYEGLLYSISKDYEYKFDFIKIKNIKINAETIRSKDGEKIEYIIKDNIYFSAEVDGLKHIKVPQTNIVKATSNYSGLVYKIEAKNGFIKLNGEDLFADIEFSGLWIKNDIYSNKVRFETKADAKLILNII